MIHDCKPTNNLPSGLMKILNKKMLTMRTSSSMTPHKSQALASTSHVLSNLDLEKGGEPPYHGQLRLKR